MNNSAKKTGTRITFTTILKQLIKGLRLIVWTVITGLLFLLFGYEFIDIIVADVEGMIYGLPLYVLVMCLCMYFWFGMVLWSTKRIHSMIGFIVSFGVFILMFCYLPPVVLSHQSASCLDSGRGVWDARESRCRTDCLTWNWQDGCVPLSAENEITNPQ